MEQPAGHAEYQLKFKQLIEATGKHRGEFGSVDQLCRLVLRDGWQMNERPPKPCNLPYDTLGSLFKGRDGFIEALHEHLQQNRGQATAVVAKQAIHGLGGVGKTRLAVDTRQCRYHGGSQSSESIVQPIAYRACLGDFAAFRLEWPRR